MTEFEKTVDYIVVGAAPPAAFLTHRLSENGDNRVLTLEAGDRDKSFLDSHAARCRPGLARSEVQLVL